MSERPQMKLAGMDGNIFSILGSACRLLKRNGQHEQASEMTERVYGSDSYETALRIISEYVETELSMPWIKNTGTRKKHTSKDHDR